jgi:hypothetical protein
LPGGDLWAIEVKLSSAPKLGRGFHQACADLRPKEHFVVYPGKEAFPLDADTRAVGLHDLTATLMSLSGPPR